MSIQWRIYCTEPGDEGWKTTWSDSEISVCPNDAGHAVNSNSIQSLSIKQQIKNFEQTASFSLSTSYRTIYAFDYNPVVHGSLHSIEMVYYLSGGTTSADIELYDVSNQTQLFTQNLTNTTESTLEILDKITSSPSSTTVLEINIKKNNGVLGSINIQSLSLFSEGNV